EIITHKKNGYLCNMGSISIAKAINNLLENKELREEIGKNARSYIIKNYSINTIYQKEYEIYRSLSNK
ncbi:MAG: glycosyltransferase, partial [Promethearchaeota archaeon]